MRSYKNFTFTCGAALEFIGYKQSNRQTKHMKTQIYNNITYSVSLRGGIEGINWGGGGAFMYIIGISKQISLTLR